VSKGNQLWPFVLSWFGRRDCSRGALAALARVRYYESVLPRFHAPAAAAAGQRLRLPEDEGRHATRVLRLRDGDRVAVFDGRGREWSAIVREVSRQGVDVELAEPILPTPEPRVAVTLAQAVLKGDHMDAAIRDATMMGVVAILPILTAHTAAHNAAATREKARERWERVAIASAKQCRRAVVPRVAAATPLVTLLTSLDRASTAGRILLAEPATGRTGLAPADCARDASDVLVAAGPEGGWGANEVEAFLECGFQPMTLGARTIRAEAASTVALSMLRAAWQDL
jgi:16S rRNA (uracil1498-N3)-methyltransferase